MKIIFWNVDTQKDFMNSDGKLYVKDAESIKPNLKKLTEIAKNHKIKVVNTADCHNENSAEISDKPDFKTTFPPHCMIDGNDGIDFIDETYPKLFEGNYSLICYTDKGLHHSFDRARNIIIYKDAFDVFAGNPLVDEVLDSLNPETIVIYGVATNVCVNFAVLGLLERGKKVYVVDDAIKELPNLPIDELIANWKEKGAELINTNQVEELLNGNKMET